MPSVSISLRGRPFVPISTSLEAITVTKNLGLHYLWIDALCIVQDDDQDSVQELARMPGIYKGAYVTLSAASASNSSEGFLQVRPPNGSVFRFTFKCPDGTMSSIYLYQKPSGSHYSDPINKRAWTLQESILSPRILAFCGQRLSWTCHSHNLSNTGFNDIPGLLDNKSALETASTKSYRSHENIPRLGGSSRTRENILCHVSKAWPPQEIDDAMKEWKSIVGQYTGRSLSVQSDKLVALAGIADEFARHVAKFYPDKPAQYSAGLWHFDLPRALLWKRSHWHSATLALRPKDYRAPSWSWASIDEAVSYQEDCYPLLEVLGDQITLKNKELLYGEVTFALLAVVGRIKQAVMTQGGTRIQDPNMPGFEDLEIASVDLDALEQGKDSISNMPVWLLEAAVREGHRALGLVLAPARLPDQSSFGGPLPLGDVNTDTQPLNAFSSENLDLDSDALIHLRRKPTPPLSPEDSDWDAGSRSDPPYTGYYFRRIGFFEMLADFRERSQALVDEEPTSWFEQEHDPNVEHISWFDDCQKRAIFLV